MSFIRAGVRPEFFETRLARNLGRRLWRYLGRVLGRHLERGAAFSLFDALLILFCVFLLLLSVGCAAPVGTSEGGRAESKKAEASEEDDQRRAEGNVELEADGDAAGADQSEPESEVIENTGSRGKQRIEMPPSKKIPVRQLMELVGPNVPERFIFVSDDSGDPLRIYHDLDQNGYEDIFFLLVESLEESGKGRQKEDSDAQAQVQSQVQPDAQASAQTQTQTQTQGQGTGYTHTNGHTNGQAQLDPSEGTGSSHAEEQRREQGPSFSEEDQSSSPGGSLPLIRDRRIAASDLANMSRLFSDEIRPGKYYVALFLRSPSGLVSMYRIPLGSWFVFEEFKGFQLNEKEKMPYAVSISFQTHEGKESQWVCFSKYNEFSFFSFKNSISVSSEVRDINDNNFVDIIEWRKVFEEGTGYETFLTWYKWDGSKFAQHDTTNIVRKLNQFLHSTSSLLSMGKWEQGFSLMMAKDLFLEMERKEISRGKLFLRLFPAKPGRDDELEIEDDQLADLIDSGDRVFNSVIVPRVLENPFSGKGKPSSQNYQTRFSIRFILRDGRSSVRECSVKMNENPFAPQQYFLQPLR